MGSNTAVPTKTPGRSEFCLYLTQSRRSQIRPRVPEGKTRNDELNDNDPPTTQLTCKLLDGTYQAVRLRLLATGSAAHQRFLMLRHSNFPLAGHAESKLDDFRPCGLC